jgi:hypothetical protein
VSQPNDRRAIDKTALTCSTRLPQQPRSWFAVGMLGMTIES